MNTIIGLYESGDKGKTSTLNMLIYMLEMATIGTPANHNILDNRQAVFNINNLTVGIGTGGDDWGSVDGNCNFFDANNCDIVFSATRKKSDSGSVQRLEQYATQYGLSVTWIRKDITNIPQNENNVNLMQALDLFNMI
ncbi:hypothetical protein [Chryseobacterium taihuense]|uniref:Uncharacterized protein n=1 Tax=Chryseobacterium taihuense TaxID=1141221 RepID=A0ABY0QTN5_9FLAO|nr:hypothetical protein [Chryseobacterium taihuense]SDL88276.1 hypothetical protein SAMN05216273_1087 [Chryseobacterium taihuense]